LVLSTSLCGGGGGGEYRNSGPLIVLSLVRHWAESSGLELGGLYKRTRGQVEAGLRVTACELDSSIAIHHGYVQLDSNSGGGN